MSKYTLSEKDLKHELYKLEFRELKSMLHTKDIDLMYLIFEVMDKKYPTELKNMLKENRYN